jgi:hypothetical protein
LEVHAGGSRSRDTTLNRPELPRLRYGRAIEGGLFCDQAGRQEHKGVLGAIEYVELPESEMPAAPPDGLGPDNQLEQALHQPAAKFDVKRDARHRREEAVMTRMIAQPRVLAVMLVSAGPFCRAIDSKNDPDQIGNRERRLHAANTWRRSLDLYSGAGGKP